MKTVYLAFKIKGDPENALTKDYENGIACCWFLESDTASAVLMARYRVEQSGWEICEIEHPPVFVTAKEFEERDLGLEAFNRCQIEGSAISFVCSTFNDELVSEEPVPLAISEEIDLNSLFVDQKEIRESIGCLHFEGGTSCDRTINAHSIQNSGALTKIAKDGEVYIPSTKLSHMKKNLGRIVFEKQNIKSVSTFRGFCALHDNELFEPIDNQVLTPTRQQVFLYAYRAICKEVFAKRCALESYSRQVAQFRGTSATRGILEQMKVGTSFGLKNLERQKKSFDAALTARNYSKIKYVAFTAQSQPSVAFSGGIFPAFGFGGERIQDLRNLECELELITFSFAPTSDGWCFLFAWLEESDEICSYFLSTLANSVYFGGSKIEDHLFRLIVKNCENSAFSPEWYDQLSEQQLAELTDALTHGARPFSWTHEDYLATKLNGFSGWNISSFVESR